MALTLTAQTILQYVHLVRHINAELGGKEVFAGVASPTDPIDFSTFGQVWQVELLRSIVAAAEYFTPDEEARLTKVTGMSKQQFIDTIESVRNPFIELVSMTKV